MDKKIPFPVLYRLSLLFDLLNQMKGQGTVKVSSAELGRALGQTSTTIRKDISFIGIAGSAGTKYSTDDLLSLISGRLGFSRLKNCCVIGLGRLGSALIGHLTSIEACPFRVVAGFESNINRLETVQSPVALFPAYRIGEMVKQLHIELAILTVPQQQAQEVADRCWDGGINGILNLTPAVVRPRDGNKFVRSMDISGELRVLSALLFTHNEI